MAFLTPSYLEREAAPTIPDDLAQRLQQLFNPIECFGIQALTPAKFLQILKENP